MTGRSGAVALLPVAQVWPVSGQWWTTAKMFFELLVMNIREYMVILNIINLYYMFQSMNDVSDGSLSANVQHPRETIVS